MTPGDFRDWLLSELQTHLDALKKERNPSMRLAIRNYMRSTLTVLDQFDLVEWPKP